MSRIKKIPFNRYIDILLFAFLLAFPQMAKIYRVDIMAKVVTMMILAIAVDLLWGYTGIMSFGQSVFFGIASYLSAISFSVRAGIPKFMMRYEVEELPIFFKMLQNPYIGVLIAILVPAVLSLLIGKILLTDKVKGVFITLITMALASTAETFINSSQKYTGGSNGIGNIKKVELFGEKLNVTQNYYFIVVILILVYLVCLFITSSKAGRVMKGIKENQDRLEFLGYKTSNFKTFVFIISGIVAGISGVLYTRTIGFVSPSLLGIAMGTTAILWVAIGGKGSLTGAMIGCLILSWAESIFSGIIPDYWEFVIGLILLIVVLFLPDGIIGSVIRVVEKKKKKVPAKSLAKG